jgi:hypothetical protein
MKSLLVISFLLTWFTLVVLMIHHFNDVDNSKPIAVRHELAILIRGMADKEHDKLHKDVYNTEANDLDKSF